jgi:hypothetical protein
MDKKEHVFSEETIYALLENTSDEKKEALKEILFDHLSEEDKIDYREIVSGNRTPSLMSDIIAKKIFDIKEHKERLEFLFREITGDEDIVFEGPAENEGYVISVDSKKMIFDKTGKTKDKRLAAIEFQISAQEFYLKRGEIYGSDLLLIQYSVSNGEKKKSLDYDSVNGVILVFLLKNSPKELKNHETDRYIHRFNKHVADSGLTYTPLVQIVYVQLDKCFEQFKQGVDGENNPKLQLMLSMLMDSNDELVVSKAREEKMFAEMLDEANKMVESREVQTMLLAEKYADADLNAVKSYERNEGRNEGRDEGRDEGEDKLGKLIVQLVSLERYDDVKKASVDKNARKKFYNEFGID